MFFATLQAYLSKLFAKKKTVCTGIEGLCILIRRLACPNRLQDISHVFGRSTAEISYIFNTVLDLIDSIHGLLSAVVVPRETGQKGCSRQPMWDTPCK